MDLWLCNYSKKRENWPRFNCRGCDSNFIYNGSSITQQCMFCTEVTLCYVVDQISTNFLNQNTDYIKQEPFYVPNSLRLEKKHIIQLFVSDMLVYIKLCGTNPNESKFRSWRNWKQTEVAECLPSFGAKSYVLQSAIQKFKDWDIQNYNFAYCLYGRETLYSRLLNKNIKLRRTEL